MLPGGRLGYTAVPSEADFPLKLPFRDLRPHRAGLRP